MTRHNVEYETTTLDATTRILTITASDQASSKATITKAAGTKTVTESETATVWQLGAPTETAIVNLDACKASNMLSIGPLIDANSSAGFPTDLYLTVGSVENALAGPAEFYSLEGDWTAESCCAKCQGWTGGDDLPWMSCLLGQWSPDSPEECIVWLSGWDTCTAGQTTNELRLDVSDKKPERELMTGMPLEGPNGFMWNGECGYAVHNLKK